MSSTGHDSKQRDTRGLSELLAEHVRSLTCDRVSLGAIASSLGERSIGAWLLVLALPMVLPVQVPGISMLFGAPLMILSVQLMLGYRRAWIPGPLAQRSIARADYAAMVDRMLPTLRRCERMVRPRATWLANDWAKRPIGLICFMLATIIVLPIPLGHVAPGTAICLLALGLMEHDGVITGLGFAATALALVIVTAASAGIVEALRHWFSD